MTVRPAPKGPIKAIGYIRVSTQEQAREGVSLEAQKRQIKAYAEMRGLTLVSIIEDAGVSASIDLEARPGGVKLFEMLRSGKAEAVIAAKLDRLFRDAADCLTTTKRWNTEGIGLHLIDMGLDTNSPMGRVFLTMAAAFAELERNTIAERTRAGLAQVQAEGGKLGVAPYGWKHGDKYVGKRRELVPVPEEQAVIKRIMTMRAQGSPYESIADVLNAEGVPTKRQGTKWRMSTVRSIAKRVAQEQAETP